MNNIEMKKEITKLRYEISRLKTKLRATNKKKCYHEEVKEIINDYLGISIDARIRVSQVVTGRNMYYFWMRSNTELSYKSISATLSCNHDHSTIIHSINTHDADYNFSKTYKLTYDNIIKLINEKLNQQQEATSRN
jgi:chromosomal replication initiation ATPase DnaA